MDKTEILNIVNEPSKHVKLMKIDGKDNIVYSAKFVELLELIPTMLTKDNMVDILGQIRTEIDLDTRIQVKHFTNTDAVIDAVLDVIDKYIKSEE